jgi:hypothetical protein
VAGTEQMIRENGARRLDGSRLLPSERTAILKSGSPPGLGQDIPPIPTGRQTAEIQGLALPIDVRQGVYPKPGLENRWRSVAVESF